VPEAVIQEMAAALADPHLGPSLAEGFAALCAVVPTHPDDLEPLLPAELAALDLAWAGPGPGLDEPAPPCGSMPAPGWSTPLW
jgi:hypothetical protein